MDKKTSELWVKIISILGIVFSSLGVVVGIALMLGAGFVGPLLGMVLPGLSQIIVKLIGTVVMVVGILIILVNAFMIYTNVNLMKHKNWARLIVLIFAAFGFLGGISSLPPGILGAAINGGIIYLLFFEKTTAGLFKN